MPFSPASSLTDRSMVWVERSIFEGVDQAIEENFGPAAGRSAADISATFARRYGHEGKTLSLANPLKRFSSDMEAIADDVLG